MSEIRKDTEGIRTNIEEIFRRLPPPPLIASRSPLSLTDFGRKVADDLNAEAWADNVAHGIWETVQEMKD